jgi:hypothetical protein
MTAAKVIGSGQQGIVLPASFRSSGAGTGAGGGVEVVVEVPLLDKVGGKSSGSVSLTLMVTAIPSSSPAAAATVTAAAAPTTAVIVATKAISLEDVVTNNSSPSIANSAPSDLLNPSAPSPAKSNRNDNISVTESNRDDSKSNSIAPAVRPENKSGSRMVAYDEIVGSSAPLLAEQKESVPIEIKENDGVPSRAVDMESKLNRHGNKKRTSSSADQNAEKFSGYETQLQRPQLGMSHVSCLKSPRLSLGMSK